jgi:hypothetical protein
MPPDCDEYARTRVLKMTCFSLKYDKDGGLCVAATRHRAYASFTYEVAHQRVDRVQKPCGIPDIGSSVHVEFSHPSFVPIHLGKYPQRYFFFSVGSFQSIGLFSSGNT